MRLRSLPTLMLLLPAFLAAGCPSGFYKHVPIYKSDQIYLYTLAEGAYPDEPAMRAQLKPVKPMPENSAEALHNLFTQVAYEEKGIFANSRDYVFAPGQLKEIDPVLADVLKANPPGVRLILVTQYDRFHSAMSKKVRTTLLFWSDGENINVVFGEINTPLVGSGYTESNSWTDIYPVNMKQAPSDLKVLGVPGFSYGKMGDRTHFTWIVLPVSSFLALKPDPDFGKPRDDKKPEPQPQGKSTVEERLKKLEELKSKKVISEQEYQEQRKRILSEM